LLARRAVDGRTWIARALKELRDELAADAGGVERLTGRERMLIDRCAAAALICMTIERHVFSSAKPIDDAGELLPVLRKGYTAHVQSLSRMLQALGLRPERADQGPPPLERDPVLPAHSAAQARATPATSAAPSPAPSSAAAGAVRSQVPR
jgi:hypothetical protein